MVGYSPSDTHIETTLEECQRFAGILLKTGIENKDIPFAPAHPCVFGQAGCRRDEKGWESYTDLEKL